MKPTSYQYRKPSLATAILAITLGFFLMVAFVPAASASEQCAPIPDVTASEDAMSEFCVILSNPVDVEINEVAKEDAVFYIHEHAELSYDVAGHQGSLAYVAIWHPSGLSTCLSTGGDLGGSITCDKGTGDPVELNVSPPKPTGICLWDASYRLVHSLGNHSGPLGPTVAPCP